CLFFFMLPLHPCSTLFPYTTLFRSDYPFQQHGLLLIFCYESNFSALTVGRNIARTELWHHCDPHFSRRRRGPKGPSRPATLQFRSEEHTSELQSRFDLVCRLLLEKK